MAAFELNATAYDVRRCDQRSVDLASYRTRASGKIGSTTRASKVSVHDVFRKTADTALGSHAPLKGGTWTVTNGAMTVVGGARYVRSQDFTNNLAINGGSLGANLGIYSQAYLTRPSNGSLVRHGVLIRCFSGTAHNGAIVFNWDSGSGEFYNLFIPDAQGPGGDINLTSGTATWPAGTSRTLRVEVGLDGSVTGYASGVAVLSAPAGTVDDIANATFAGLRLQNSTGLTAEHPRATFFAAGRIGGVASVRAWDVDTEILTAAEIDALEAAITAPGTVTVSGELIGEAVTVRGEYRDRQDGPLSDQSALSFALHEVEA
jgi:hypothetical protein